MAKHFKNFSKGFRIKPTALSTIENVGYGDITYDTSVKKLKYYGKDGQGDDGWLTIQDTQSNIWNGKSDIFVWDRTRDDVLEAASGNGHAGYINKTGNFSRETGADPRASFYCDDDDYNYTQAVTNDGYVGDVMSANTLVLDMHDESYGKINFCDVHLPKGDAFNIGQTITIVRRDSHKIKESVASSHTLRVKIHGFRAGSAENTHQQIKLTGLYYFHEGDSWTDQEALSQTGTYAVKKDENYIILRGGYNKAELMWNGAKWILLSGRDDIQNLLPVGTILTSVLNPEEFNKETVGYWMLCNGDSCVGTRLGQITDWNDIPDLMGSGTDGGLHLRSSRLGTRTATSGDTIISHDGTLDNSEVGHIAKDSAKFVHGEDGINHGSISYTAPTHAHKTWSVGTQQKLNLTELCKDIEPIGKTGSSNDYVESEGWGDSISGGQWNDNSGASGHDHDLKLGSTTMKLKKHTNFEEGEGTANNDIDVIYHSTSSGSTISISSETTSSGVPQYGTSGSKALKSHIHKTKIDDMVGKMELKRKSGVTTYANTTTLANAALSSSGGSFSAGSTSLNEVTCNAIATRVNAFIVNFYIRVD